MASRPFDAMSELQNAFTVLFKNWVLAIPPAIVGLAYGIFFITVVAAMIASFAGAAMMGGLSAPNGPTPHYDFPALLAAGGASFIIGMIVLFLLNLLAQAMVMAGAERVWHGQAADLAHGISRALGKLPNLILLFIVGCIVAFICAIIIIIGWLAGLVLIFLFMYTLPAIVVGNEGVFAALGTSFRLTTKNAGPSLMAFLGIFVVNIVAAIINKILFAIPGHVLGVIGSVVVGGLTAAYSALVLVRFYDRLRETMPASAIPAGPTV